MSKTSKAPKAEDVELEWYKTVYQGDTMPQLTLRALVMGSVLGGVMSLSNLYVGLKTGWALGVAITACILSFAIYKSLMGAFPKLFKTEMSILENNCMQSTASSAGYSTGGTMVSAISAYLIVTGHHIPWPVLAWWTFFLASLGVFMAIPMKRQMINVEQLRFPSGIAAAETLKSLHSKGKVASQKARALGLSGLVGAIITWCRDAGKPAFLNFPSNVGLFPGASKATLMGIPLIKWTLSFEMSTIMIAAGAIMGWKVCWSMLFGATVNYAILAPWMVHLGAISGDPAKMGYRAIVAWSTWGGAAIMVTSGMLQFVLQWRTIARAFSGLGELFGGGETKQRKDDPMERIEVPSTWFLTGTILSGMGCVAVLYHSFGTTIWMGVFSVIMTFFLSVVACRATGESDITPIGAMGKVTQLFFGAISPANLVTNLMTASVTAGAAGSSADLLTDLKSGYLLGANPRKQFLAQFVGIFAGTLVVVPAFYLLVPDAASLGTDKWPAPSAQVWAAVARLLGSGLHALHPTARIAILIGGALGIILPLLELAFPKAAKYLPSPMGLGLSMVIPFFNSLSMFIGAVIAIGYEKRNPVMAERFVIPVASGLIAGESLMGIVVALLSSAGVI
ncbi:MAG: OPT/YSL family transporter [Deltaproteobacteria bacterium]|nr:OPT/YSL family transporter [Deltaproteobacteria bacterium]